VLQRILPKAVAWVTNKGDDDDDDDDDDDCRQGAVPAPVGFDSGPRCSVDKEQRGKKTGR